MYHASLLAYMSFFATVGSFQTPAVCYSSSVRCGKVSLLAKSTSRKAGKVKEKTAPKARGFGTPQPVTLASKATALDNKPEWSAFTHWLGMTGAITDAVTLTEFPGGLRGLRATRAIKQGEDIIRIPRAAILDESAADASAVGSLWRDAASPLPGYAKLGLAVLHELRLGDSSAYAPYLRLLPTAAQFAEDGGPAAMWSDAELAITENGKLIADATRLRSNRRNGGGHPALERVQLEQRWEELGLPGNAPTAEEVEWAVTAVTSRAYTIQVPTPAAGPSSGDGNSPPISGLIPMVSLMHMHQAAARGPCPCLVSTSTVHGACRWTWPITTARCNRTRPKAWRLTARHSSSWLPDQSPGMSKSS